MKTNILREDSKYGLFGTILAVLLAILIGVIVGFGGSLNSQIIIFVLIAILSITVILIRPYLGVILLMIVIVNPFLLSDKIAFPLPGLGDSLELREMVFLFLILLALINAPKRKWPRSLAILTPAILFSALVCFFALLSLLRGISAGNVLAEAFPWLTYLFLPVVVAALIRNEKELNIILISFLSIAVIGALLTMMQTIVGPETVLIGSRQLKYFHGSVRVYSESVGFILIALSILIALLLGTKNNPHRIVYLIASITIILALTASISRTMMVAMVLVFTLLLFWTKKSGRLRSFIILTIIITLSLTAISSIRLSESSSIFDTASYWFTRIFTEEGKESLSIVGRSTQYKIAIQEIIRQPLWGVGIGNKSVFLDTGLDIDVADQVHNGYLQVALKMGLIGLGLFSFWIFAGMLDIYHLVKRAEYRWVLIGKGIFVGTGVIWLVSNVVTWVVSPGTLAQIGTALGIIEAYHVIRGANEINQRSHPKM
jgi:O-antigen ligase